MTIHRQLRVFLCYAKEDKPIVQNLYRQLTSEDWLNIWLDEEKLLPGQDWDMEIKNAVEQADAVVVCLSHRSIDKEGYVQKELRFVLRIAEEKPGGTIFVIPLRLDECIVPRELRAWQWVDYFPTSNREWAFRRLLSSLVVRAAKFDISTSSSRHKIEDSGWITNAAYESNEDDIATKTKIKLIGLGQCGSFIVYDTIAYLFDQTPSKDIKAAPQAQWNRDVGKAISRISNGSAQLRISLKRYFGVLKTPDIPKFYIIDSNHKNAVVDGLQGAEINKKLGPLRVLVAALTPRKRNNACKLGQVGEYVFRKEKALDHKNSIFNKLRIDEPVEINALVFAGGGGTGSGGAPALNADSRNKGSLLFNMIVLPPYRISDRRQCWNTGRCIMRLAAVHKQTSLLLFSNLSESLNAQSYVNQYVSKLIVRLANFGYTGNVPKVATEIDRKDLQLFFSAKPAFVGLSALSPDTGEPSKEEIEHMVDRALASRKQQNIEEQESNDENIFGLSIEVPEILEQVVLRQIKTVMIVIGLTPKYEGKINIVDIVKRRVAARLGIDSGRLDCQVRSYRSPNEIELTVFLRHSNYQSSFLLDYFLKSYLHWYSGEKNEAEYLKNIMEKVDDDFIDTLRSGLEEEVDTNNPNWLQAFDFPIDRDLGAVYLPSKKGTVTPTSPGD